MNVKQNNKGFMLVESIIVVSIISIFIISLYGYVNRTLKSFEEVKEYETINDIYKINILRDCLYENGYFKNINFEENNKIIILNPTGDGYCYKVKEELSTVKKNNMISTSNNYVYLLNDLSDATLNSININDDQYKKYLRQQYKKSNDYILITQFESGKFVSIEVK